MCPFCKQNRTTTASKSVNEYENEMKIEQVTMKMITNTVMTTKMTTTTVVIKMIMITTRTMMTSMIMMMTRAMMATITKRRRRKTGSDNNLYPKKTLSR